VICLLSTGTRSIGVLRPKASLPCTLPTKVATSKLRLGRIDGVNDTFYLDPLPYVDEEFGRPCSGVARRRTAREGVDYTLVDGVIVFETPPPCPVGESCWLLAGSLVHKEYLIYGKKPIAVWFCDSPSCGYGDGACGGPCSDGCRWVHALFESDILTELDVCGTGDTQRYGIVATFEHKNDLIRFADADVLKDAGVAGVVDGVCSTICDNQTSVIASLSTLWEGSGQSWLDSNAPIPSGSFVKKLAYSNYTDNTYALFGNQGVLKRGADGWFVTKLDVPTGDVHVAIDANGCIVATIGAGTMSYSRDDGRSWTTVTLPAGETGLDVGIGIPHELSITEGVIYALTANATRTTLWVTGDYGRTWLRRHVWATVPVCNAQIEVAADDWFIYVHLDGVTWRNTNYGCDQCGAWEKLADDAPCDSILAVCHHEPDVAIIIGVKYGAVDDFFQVADTGLTLIPILFNDVSLPPGCTLDVTSVVLTTNFGPGTGTAEVTGEVEVDAGVGPLTGFDYAVYTVEADCADGSTILYTANIIVEYIDVTP
jgi:hypothetical protein